MNNLKKHLNEDIKKELLLELWENSIFDNNSYELLESIVIDQSQKEDPFDISYLELNSSELYLELSTIRNRNLISKDDQRKLSKTTVGFFGLSVGSHAALTWMMESRADAIKIIDPDTISASNLNRLRFGWKDVGRPKIEVVKEYLEDINPYSNIITCEETSLESVEKLFYSEPAINIVIDAVDDLSGKIVLRNLAKSLKIPLIMATDVGDNVILDIERYDLNPQPEFFLGRVSGIEYLDITKLTFFDRIKLTFKIVGFEENSEQMLESLSSIGKNLATWPQLGATASLAGGIISTVIKKLVLEEKVESGRYYFSLDSLLVSDFNDIRRREERKTLIEKLKSRFSLVEN
jgi:tRNA threonylcarbamoyladenosine dehydratase